MSRAPWLWALGGGALLWWLSREAAQGVNIAVDTVGSGVESGVDAVTAAVIGWESVQEGPQWMPVINAAENQYGIPHNLLARMAYQESHFRQEYIDGSKPSRAGALGILQLMPRYFPSVRVARPFTDQDTAYQIDAAARELVRLYSHYQDWGLALAGYNWGQGNLDDYLDGNGVPVPKETATYISQVLSDVPVSGATQALA